jgi:hypothetical protein
MSMKLQALLILLAVTTHGVTSQTTCPAGQFWNTATSICTPCAAISSTTYSYGGAATACASCAPGYTFVTAATGCRPSPSTGAADTIVSFSADLAETTDAYAVNNRAYVLSSFLWS